MAPQLPAELIERCFSFVDSTDKATCAAVCLTNSIGRRAGKQRLYENIGIAGSDEEDEKLSRRLRLLCRSLSENLDLTEIPTCARHQLHESISDARNAQSTVKAASIRALWEMPGKHFTNSRVGRPILEAVEADTASDEHYVSLMLALCPNLKVLEFTGQVQVLRHMHFLQNMIAQATKNDNGIKLKEPFECGLSTVEHVRIDHDEDITSLDIRVVLEIHSLRSLWTSCFWEKPHDGNEKNYVPMPKKTSVQHLDLQYCSCKLENLSELLESAKDLRSLDIQFMSEHDAHWRYDWWELGEDLTANCTRLEKLRCVYRPERRMGPGDSSFDIPARGIGSLQKLRSLRELVIPKNALLGTPGLDEYEAEFPDSDSEMRRRTPPYVELLPISLKDLTVLLEAEDVNRTMQNLRKEAHFATIPNFTVWSIQEEKWLSTKEAAGESIESTKAELKRKKEELARHHEEHSQLLEKRKMINGLVNDHMKALEGFLSDIQDRKLKEMHDYHKAQGLPPPTEEEEADWLKAAMPTAEQLHEVSSKSFDQTQAAQAATAPSDEASGSQR